MGDKIKSSYEIAMEKADQISKNTSEEDKIKFELRNELKPLFAKYYKDKISVEELWEELEDEDEDYLIEAQLMIIESLGLRSSQDEYRNRKKAILAIESLKNSQNTSGIEQTLGNVRQLQQQYNNERERLENQLQKEAEKNTEMQMKPVQTEDGRTVMKLDAGLDQETKKKYNQAISNLESQSDQRFNNLIEELKEKVK